MSAALAFMPPRTVEEFLDWERHQGGRFEWDGVQPVAMVGGPLGHSELAARVEQALRQALRAGRVRVFRADVGVRTEGGTRMRFPDLTVTCSPVRPSDWVIPAPVLIVEVLSDSTVAIDRGVKRAEYAALPSLSRYVMLAQDAALALVCDRAGSFAEQQERETLALPGFGITVPLASSTTGCSITPSHPGSTAPAQRSRRSPARRG